MPVAVHTVDHPCSITIVAINDVFYDVIDKLFDVGAADKQGFVSLLVVVKDACFNVDQNIFDALGSKLNVSLHDSIIPLISRVLLKL